ncbi:MAG: hypothetical protein WCX88_03925 [Patescibacteria group bacterium]
MFEQNKNQIENNLANLGSPTGKSEELEIHTIPDKFKTPTNQIKKGGSKKLFWVLGIIVFLILIAGGAYFFVTKYGPGKVQPVVEKVTEPINQTPTEFISAKQTLTGRINDSNEVMIAQLDLNLPEGAMTEDFSINIVPKAVSVTDTDPKYKMIGAIYTVDYSGDEIVLTKPAELSLYYSKDLIDPALEKYLVVGYKSGADWQVLESKVDSSRYVVTANQDGSLKKEYALIIPIELYNQVSNKNNGSMISILIPKTSDQDGDGLTDIEEGIFTTDPVNKDTDSDGYDDRTEILNLYSPKQGPGLFLLAETNLVKEYKLKSGYSVLAPSGFVVTEAGEIIMFKTSQSEFFQITVQENPTSASIREWYMLQAPDVSYDQVKIYNINGLEAVVGPDSTAVYIGVGDKVYVLNYAVADATELAYETTFEMFVKSFKLATK